MLKDAIWSENRAYRTSSKWEPVHFYLEALNESVSFDLLLGYFSSAAINVLSLGFAKFLSSGGKMRMVINDVLSSHDKETLSRVKDGYIYQIPFDIANFNELKSRLDDYDTHFFNCLGWLIQNDRIEIKVIKPLGKKGISHYKCGVFSDGVNKVGFSGSCNFTAFGLLENLERIDSFLSWENGRSNKWIASQTEEFEEIFTEKADYVEYLDVEQVKVAIINTFGDKDLDELLVQEQHLIESKLSLLANPKIKATIEATKEKIEAFREEPRFPYLAGPREYQTDAYNNWKNNGGMGIFAMATGTGKTITSLNCLLNEYKASSNNTYHAIILVPTITLVEQWEKEVRSFNFQEIIKIASKFSWEGELATQLSNQKYAPTSFVIISTYASFVKPQFQRYIKQLPEDTIFIADEGHNIASPSVLKRLVEFPLAKRIGLSATPKRIYDLEGTAEMEVFFNDREPYTYSFGMERAIQESVLCKYNYYPHIVTLTEGEFAEYNEITLRLSQLYSFGRNKADNEDLIEKLLLKRKRIIHKAERKLGKTIEILEDQLKENGNLRYTFIYVPEGVTTELPEDGDDNIPENIKIIDQYTRAIGRIHDRITVNKFVSGMSDRNEILRQFQTGDIQVLASMKCLDEGVDIPRAEFAIFCSSTGNPRQFIQRRGRILRKHEDKHMATIHDLVVIPDYTATSDAGAFEVERNLIRTELERVMYFASLAENPYYTEDVFKDVCDHYNLNIYSIQSQLKTV